MRFMRFLLTTALCSFVTTGAQAQAKTYGALSVIGDKLVVLRVTGGPGRHFHNQATAYSLPKDVFNRFARDAVRDAVRRIEAEAPVVSMSMDDAVTLDSQETLVQEGRAIDAVLNQAITAARGEGITHLFIVTKDRAPLRVQVRGGMIRGDEIDGFGQVWGLGFHVNPYVDTRQDMYYIAGYLAPFAYLRVALVDVAKGVAISDRASHAAVATARPAREVKGIDPWDLLSAEQKTAVLKRLVQAGITAVVQDMLATPNTAGLQRSSSGNR